MTTLSTSEILAISGGTCYSAGVSIFGLNIGIHIGDCPLDK